MEDSNSFARCWKHLECYHTAVQIWHRIHCGGPTTVLQAQKASPKTELRVPRVLQFSENRDPQACGTMAELPAHGVPLQTALKFKCQVLNAQNLQAPIERLRALNLSSPGEVVSERHDDHIESFASTERIFPSLGKIGASPCACVPNAPVDDVDWSGGNDGRV